MKLTMNYKHVHSQRPVESEVTRHVEKLNRLLKCYDPDLVLLHGAFAPATHKHEEHSCALNLSLPTGTLHATATASTARASCKKAFNELESQLKKHQSRLRKDYEWKRKRRPRARLVPATD